jgi:hypothetical protein
MPYCGERHRMLHWRAGHHEDCARMAQQKGRLTVSWCRPPPSRPHRLARSARLSSLRPSQEMLDLPFDFVHLEHEGLCAVLSELGVHLHGLWARQCACLDARPWGSLCPVLRVLFQGSPSTQTVRLSRAHMQEHLPDWYGAEAWQQLPCMLSAAPPHAAAGGARAACQPADWASFYALRGLESSSGAALLLDAVMTCYWAAAQLPRRLPEAGRPLVLHVLGARKEFEQWPLLLELGCLLPGRIEVHLVGPAVPLWAHDRAVHVDSPSGFACGREGCSCGREAAPAARGSCGGVPGGEAPAPPHAGEMRIVFWRGEYHAVRAAHELPAADAIVGPNAGKIEWAWWCACLRTCLSRTAGLAHRL